MDFEKVLEELDALPELGLNTCEVGLVFKQGLNVSILYQDGKIQSATTLNSAGEVVNIIANAVLVYDIPREIDYKGIVTIQGTLTKMGDLEDAFVQDRDEAATVIPDFDFWVHSVATDKNLFDNSREKVIWLQTMGFRAYPVYHVTSSSGMLQLADAFSTGQIGMLPPYVDPTKISVMGLSVHSVVFTVDLPEHP